MNDADYYAKRMDKALVEIAELKQILRDARAWIEDPMIRLDNGHGPATLTCKRVLEAIDKAL